MMDIFVALRKILYVHIRGFSKNSYRFSYLFRFCLIPFSLSLSLSLSLIYTQTHCFPFFLSSLSIHLFPLLYVLSFHNNNVIQNPLPQRNRYLPLLLENKKRIFYDNSLNISTCRQFSINKTR